MPHLIMQYSPGLEQNLDMDALCVAMHEQMLATGVFPLAGIRVRAIRCDHAEVADRLAQNAFVDMVLRIGEGRGAEDRHRVGEQMMERAEEVCAKLLDQPHFALSLEIVEISRDFSWKTNSMHARLSKQG